MFNGDTHTETFLTLTHLHVFSGIAHAKANSASVHLAKIAAKSPAPQIKTSQKISTH